MKNLISALLTVALVLGISVTGLGMEYHSTDLFEELDLGVTEGENILIDDEILYNPLILDEGEVLNEEVFLENEEVWHTDEQLSANEISADTAPPVVVGISLSSISVKAPDIIQVTCRVVDDSPIDARRFTIYFQNKKTGASLRPSNCIYSDGAFIGTINIDNNTTQGTYIVSTISIYDTFGNSAVYYGNGFRTIGTIDEDKLLPAHLRDVSFSVLGNDNDTTPPEVTDISLSKNVVTPPDSINVTWSVVDDLSPILDSYGSIGFYSTEARRILRTGRAIFFDGKFTATINIGADVPYGTYYIQDVHVQDLAGNSTIYFGKGHQYIIGSGERINWLPEKLVGLSITVTPESTPPSPDPANDVLIEEYVQRCYEKIIGRVGDDEGVGFWKNALKNGDAAGADIVSLFCNSDEFQNKNLPSESGVRIIYGVMLNREPDAGGIAYWTGLLNKGVSYNLIISGFAGSTEFVGICGEYGIKAGTVELETRDLNPSVTAFVSRCYQQALGRTGDAGGLNHWAAILLGKTMTPQEVSYGFLFSEECRSMGLSDDEFINRLYRLYMDREADTGGQEYWQNQLTSGASRETAARGFADSAEFTGIVQSYGLG